VPADDWQLMVMAKKLHLIMKILMPKCGESNTNSPKLSLLKTLLLAYDHSHFLATTLNFIFFTMVVLLGTAHFLQLGCFGFDLGLGIIDASHSSS